MDGNHAGAKQFHLINIEGLPFDILRSHVNVALKIKKTGSRCARNTVLTCTGFGNNSLLSQGLGQESLS